MNKKKSSFMEADMEAEQTSSDAQPLQAGALSSSSQQKVVDAAGQKVRSAQWPELRDYQPVPHVVPLQQYDDWRGRGGPKWFDLKMKPPQPDQRELGGVLLALVVIAVIAAVIFTGVFSYTGTQNQTVSHPLAVSNHPKIIISNDGGAITIHGQANGPYGIHEQRLSSGLGIGLKNIEVDYNQLGNTTSINARIERNLLFMGTRAVNLDVAVPENADITTYTQFGTIDISNVSGSIAAETGEGAINVTHVNGDLDVRTNAGSVSLASFKGTLTANITNGNITTQQTSLSGHSVLNVESGSISFQGLLDRQGSYDLETSTGPIVMKLPASSVFHLSIAKGSGHVINEFGHNAVGQGSRANLSIGTQNDPIELHKIPTTR